MNVRTWLLLSSMTFTLAACAPGGGFAASGALSGNSAKSLGSGESFVKTPEGLGDTSADSSSGSGSGSGSSSSAIKICSKLLFPSLLTWPQALSKPTDREMMKLALNISGSFEGSTGWANLTNDFDGQGLSMGLLNQTLNTGSLEPLFVNVRNSSLPVLKSKMTAANLDAWLSMLANWEGTSTGNSKALVSGDGTPETGTETGAPLSRFDIDTRPSSVMEKVAADRNAAAAAWARAHLYDSNGKFLSSWSKDLTSLATSSEYISVQIGAAQKYHAKAKAYQQQFSTSSLRAYLFFFDIIVQNGSLYAEDVADYATWLKSNAGASETARLTELLTLRLRHVRSEYVSDVKTRKLTLINGSGTVHGTIRKLESEYCFDRTTKIFN